MIMGVNHLNPAIVNPLIHPNLQRRHQTCKCYCRKRQQQQTIATTKCFICGKEGHWAKNCPKKPASKTFNTMELPKTWTLVESKSLHTTDVSITDLDSDDSSPKPFADFSPLILNMQVDKGKAPTTNYHSSLESTPSQAADSLF